MSETQKILVPRRFFPQLHLLALIEYIHSRQRHRVEKDLQVSVFGFYFCKTTKVFNVQIKRLRSLITVITAAI